MIGRASLATRPLAALLLAMLAVPAASVARAEESATAPEALPYLDEPPDVGLLPSHRAEWLAGTDAVSLFAPTVSPSLGLGLEAVRAFDARQRHRVGVHLGALLAADPEEQKPAIHLWPGLRYRFSFYMDDLFDWYGLARVDFPVGSDPFRAGVLSPGAGVGVRLARTAAIEASFMLPIGLFSEVELGRKRADVWAAFGVAITVDLCRVGVDCERPAPRQRTRDCTSELYEQAQRTCLEASPTQHARLCEAVMSALDGADYAPLQGEDSTQAFLRGLLKELGDAPEQAALRSDVDALEATHGLWHDAVDRQRHAAQMAARDERTLLYWTSYAPSAVELRRVLGCYPGAGRERCPALVEPAPFAPHDKKPKKKLKKPAWTCEP